MRIFFQSRVFAPTFKSPNPGLCEFFSNLGCLHQFFKARTQGYTNFCRAELKIIMINENRACTAWRARTKTTDLQQIFEKNHGEVAISKIPSKAPHPGINQICSEKNLDCQNSVNKAKAPGQDNTPKLQVFFVHFFFFFFNMYRKKQHYDKATPLI